MPNLDNEYIKCFFLQNKPLEFVANTLLEEQRKAVQRYTPPSAEEAESARAAWLRQLAEASPSVVPRASRFMHTGTDLWQPELLGKPPLVAVSVVKQPTNGSGNGSAAASGAAGGLVGGVGAGAGTGREPPPRLHDPFTGSGLVLERDSYRALDKRLYVLQKLLENERHYQTAMLSFQRDFYQPLLQAANSNRWASAFIHY